MKINSKLEHDSTFDPTKESQPISLENLCKMIEKGKMSLPIFQTYIRWNIEKSIALLNFQLSGKAAVSPISVNKIENPDLAVPQISFLTREPLEGDLVGKESVNDGQQRLSCNYKAYVDHEEFKDVVLDLSKGKFILNKKEKKTNQIPVGKIYNKDAKVFEQYLKEHPKLQSFEIQNLLTKIRNKFLGYYYTVNYAKDLTEEEQREWFIVLNLAGSTGTGVQVYLTEMLVKGVDYYKEYADPYMTLLKEHDFYSTLTKKETEVSIPLASLNTAYEKLEGRIHKGNFSPIPSDAKPNLISKLSSEKIRLLFEMTLTALQKSIDFIEYKTDRRPNRIDYITYLTGFFVMHGNSSLTKEQEERILEWYYSTDFNKKDNGERRKKFEELLSIM